MIYGWSPRIGDPSVLGWLTVFAYFGSSLLCIRAANRDTSAPGLWRILAFSLVVLGLNKQLDLQTLLTQLGRELARTDGWYDRRRQIQQVFVVVIGVASVALSISAFVLLKGRSRAIRVASAGFFLLVTFVFVRAASFHHVDRFLKSAVLGARFNWIFELGGLAVMGIAAARAIRPASRDESR